MGAVRYWVRIDVRRRWRSFVLAGLVLGVVGAGALGCVAAARRTAGVHERLLAVTAAPEVAVEHGTPGSPTYVDGDLIADLPEVERVGRGRPFLAGPVNDEGLLDPALSTAVLTSDGHLYYDIARPLILQGEMPDPSRLDQALINTAAADLLGIGLGDEFGIRIITFDDVEALEKGDLGVGTLVELTVTGIARSDGSGFWSMGAEPAAITTPALARAHPRGLTYGLLLAELENGDADVAAFTQGVERLSGGGSAAVYSRADAVEELTHTTRPYVAAWIAASLALTLVAAATAVQVMGRLTSRTDDEVALSAFGLTKAERGMASALRALLVALVAVAVAVGLALASSASTLVGPAADLEPDPGLRVDGPTLLAGGVLLFLVVIAAPFLRVSSGSSRQGIVADALARLRMPFAVVAGARLGRSGLGPSRSALVGTGAGLLVLTGAVTFGSSLDRVLATPALYGNDYDVRVGNAYRSISPEDTERVLDEDPTVASYSLEIVEGLNVGGIDVDASGLAPGKGSPGPSVTEGRLPTAVDEIALGGSLADRLHKDVGDEVEVRFDRTTRSALIVGEVVGPFGSYTTGPGSGVVLSYDGLKVFRPASDTDNYFVRLTPGATPDAFVQRILDWQGEAYQTDDVGVPSAPPTLVDVGRIRDAPYLVAGVLAVLAVAALVHTLLTTLRLGRRDLALLRVFGASRSQVRSVVMAQSVVLVGSAALVSVPLGVMLGRLAWRSVATSLGVVVQPVVPAWLVLVVPAALLVALTAAVGPARRAGGASPAPDLGVDG